VSRRVVVTGMAGLSPLGADWTSVRTHLREGTSGVRDHPGWEDVEGLEVRIAADIREEDFRPDFPRKATRSMGRVALLATEATRCALEDAGLREAEALVVGIMRPLIPKNWHRLAGTVWLMSLRKSTALMPSSVCSSRI